MRAATALFLGFGLLAAPAAAQEVALTATRSGTAAPLQLWASYGDGGWSVRVADDRGRERQRFMVRSEVADPPPWLADADGDGAADLWVPAMTGTANTTYAVWTMQPRDGRFRAAGEVSGLIFARDPGGWLVAQGRNGCCAVSLVFHAVSRGDGTLREAFAIERVLAPDGTARSCTPRGRVPQDVLRPWCASRSAEALPPGVVALR
ncbi:MAG: hypothetical protein K2X49_07150 [Acetobacteraceae bacterium]|nr:hypothetical protein [Acetobacteraceae bacterium]